jgi:hypothetical protein
MAGTPPELGLRGGGSWFHDALQDDNVSNHRTGPQYDERKCK